MSLCYTCGLPKGVSSFQGGCICNVAPRDPFYAYKKAGKARYDYVPYIQSIEKPKNIQLQLMSNKRKYSDADIARNREAAMARKRARGLASPQVTMPNNSLARQAVRTGGWANPVRGGELKFKDLNVTLNPVANSTTFSLPILLNGLIPGSGASERIGRKVTWKSLLIRYSHGLAVTSTGGAPLRILVIYDKQANAAAPFITDVLLADNFNSPNNLSNRDRFVTLFDHMVEPISVQGDFQRAGVLYKNFQLETMFNAGVAGTVGDIASGSIYFAIAQGGRILTADSVFDIRARLRYTDV